MYYGDGVENNAVGIADAALDDGIFVLGKAVDDDDVDGDDALRGSARWGETLQLVVGTS